MDKLDNEVHICEHCGKDHDGSYGSGRFCSEHCAKSYGVKHTHDWKCCHCDFIARTRDKLRQHNKINHPQFANKGWAKCLTKDTCKSISNAVNKLHQRYETGDLINPFKGKYHSDEVKQKISESMRKAHFEGRASTWIGRRKKSYAEQSWFNIFEKEFGINGFRNNYYPHCHGYWLDFAWPEKKIYFEVDGETHFTNEGIEKDKIRTERLAEAGWKLIGRCNWSEYQKLSFEEKEKFVKSILSQLRI